MASKGYSTVQVYRDNILLYLYLLNMQHHHQNTS